MRPQPGLIIPMLISLLLCLPGSNKHTAAAAAAQGAASEFELALKIKTEEATPKSAISKSDTINDGTFHRSQSKRAATLAKSLPLILATTQITKANGEQIAATPTATATIATMQQTTIENEMHTNVSLSAAVVAAVPLPYHDNINNINNNGDQRRWISGSTIAASVAGVTAALQPNLIMSNRNVEEQQLDEHKYKITQNNALFVPNSSSSSNNNSTATQLTAFGVAEATTATTPAAAAAATTTEQPTTTTATTTTTRRPPPTTTLKPPPTIDDYQTIISQAGTHAYLPCNVKQLVKKPISWLRMRDGHILTVDQTTFIADQRFQSVFSPNPERWSLQIKYVQLKDEGTYECQVSTEPKASAIVQLRIVEPKTELIGESTRHVKAGSQVKLRCIISQALEPPLFINWFYNQKQIYLHNRRGWRTEIERIDLPTEVPTTPSAATSTAGTQGDSLNDIAAITRSYILDAITVSDGTLMAGYGYVLPTTAAPTPTAATMSTLTAAAAAAAVAVADAASVTAAADIAVADEGGAEILAADTPATLTYSAATAITAAITTIAAATTTTTTTAATTTTTTTTTEPSTTTTTMLPSSSFIKQITTASLIIPAVVKLDSGNYTCSPSNSAPRTIVLHVLNGEYSASAIKSASVSWNTLIGYPGYLQWRNVTTILTLLWIIKFVLARNMTICYSGQNKVNNRTELQEPTPAATATATRTQTTTRKTTVISRRLSTQTQTTTRRQRRFGLQLGFDCGCGCGSDCGHVSSSISGTKVAEDKT